jgi:hypothetical protein
LKFPEDVRDILTKRYQNKHCEWLGNLVQNQWPIEISLGLPTESKAIRQTEKVRSWLTAWQSWHGHGSLIWCERRWQVLGLQRLPDKLCLQKPEEVALWLGELKNWQKAQARYQNLITLWPTLALLLPRYFDVLANYNEIDFQCLLQTLKWLNTNPNSNLYLRQLPIPGIDSKWLENRKKILLDLITAIQQDTKHNQDFFKRCGLKTLPYLIRLRVLDPKLRQQLGGLSDITTPWEELADLQLSIARIFIVENLQTGLAFSDMPNSAVFMGLGYNVEILARIPWIHNAQCIYWGDIDTHGFAILNRARSALPILQSVLMDEETLGRHKELWVKENKPHAAVNLELLTTAEQDLYQGLKQQRWGQNVRLEQERIDWSYASRVISSFFD